MLIKIENGKPVGNPINNESFYRLFPETSFPAILTPEDVEAFGYGVYALTPQPILGVYEKAVEITPVKDDNGVWVQTWEVVPMSAQEIAEKNAMLEAANKSQAEQLLKQTDWTATVDINNPQFSNPYLGNQDAFLAYRSQVRQIAINPPVIVEVWPTKPDEVWVSV